MCRAYLWIVFNCVLHGCASNSEGCLVSLPCLFFVELEEQIRPSRAATKTKVFLTSIGDFEQDEKSL